MMRDASLERTPYGSLLDSPAFGALRDRGTTRRPTIPRQGSGRRVSSRLSVTRTVTAEGHPRWMANSPPGPSLRIVAPSTAEDGRRECREDYRNHEFREFGNRNRRPRIVAATAWTVILNREGSAARCRQPEFQEVGGTPGRCGGGT